MKLKNFLSILATFTMLLPFAGCGAAKEVKGAETEDKLDITPPDLTTEYVESGFLEYYKIYSYNDPMAEVIRVENRCAYRTLRDVDEKSEQVEVTLFYGGEAEEETPLIDIEFKILGGEEEIHLCTIPKEKYITNEYKIDRQTTYHIDKNYCEEKIEYNHSENVTIPMSYFSGNSGFVCIVMNGTVEDQTWECGWCIRYLYYTKENGKIKFMSAREHAYVTDGSLIY